ncbi:glycine cleavage system protein GcvH [Microvirga sp. W0021]|uniref:Glycine cleavage system H protein n=1 Tax=Hohaiivirga grylli TaxID=3133970 RepID=A0ABV0BIJ6_9HYPH
MTTYYSKDHEYIRIEGNVGVVGITDHAQSQLGDVVYVELPKVGSDIAKGGEAAVVESVKAASDVYTPVSGKIVEVNGELEATPNLVNEAAERDGWFFRIELSDKSELDGLMDEAGYKKFVAENA